MFYNGPKIKELEFPADLDIALAQQITKQEFIFGIIKLIIGILSIILGAYLIIIGVISDAYIELEINGAKMHFNKAMPGVIVIVLAFTLLIFSRFNIKIK